MVLVLVLVLMLMLVIVGVRVGTGHVRRWGEMRWRGKLYCHCLTMSQLLRLF